MQKKSELLEGWELVSINDILEVNPSKPQKDVVPPNTPVTFVPMPAVDADSGAINAPEIRDFSKVRKGYTAFQNEDVIFAKITPCMENGKAAVARNLLNNFGFGSTEFFVFRSKGAILPDYLYNYIRQDSYRKLAESKMTGSVGQKRVPKEFVQNSSIPLPPLAEQHRIISKIEALFARLDAANERLDRVPEILKTFKQSVLAAACDGRLTEGWRKEHPDVENLNEYLQEINKIREGCSKKDKLKFKTLSEFNVSNLLKLPDSWLWIPSNLIFSYVTSGSRGWAKYYSDTGPMFIRIGNLDRNSIYLNLENVQRVSPPDNSEGRRTRIQQNDILISITADIGSIGYICEDIGDAYINQHIALARPVQNLNPKFIAFFLHSQTGGKKQFEKQHRGATKIGLGLDDIRSIAIPLPPLPEQHEIVRRVDALFSLVDSIEAKVAAARERTEKLRQSILAKAFSGELVPTEAELARLEGRDYEPADALLERIKAEQAKSEKKGKAAK